MRQQGRQECGPLASVVLLAHNGAKIIHDCASSIVNQHYRNLEVIVIDNGSKDESVPILKACYPDWTYLEYEDNRGFASGMNSGIALARGDYVLPLNQDVYLDRDFINRSVEIMETLPHAGALGAMEYKWSGGKLTDELRSPGPALYLRLRIQGTASKINRSPAPCFGVCGSFPFLRSEALAELQQLDGHVYDPDFFSGWEDQDLWWRLQLRGWQCYATRDTRAWHVGSSFVDEKQSFISKPPEYQRWVMRNRWFVILKNIPSPLLLLLSPLLITLELVLPFFLIFQSRQTLGSWVGGWQDILYSFTRTLSKRHVIQRNRRIPLTTIIRWFKGI